MYSRMCLENVVIMLYIIVFFLVCFFCFLLCLYFEIEFFSLA